MNACLYPLCAVHGKAITTVEGIGSTKTKLHAVQVNFIEMLSEHFNVYIIKGNYISNQNWTYFVHYLKIINTVIIVKQIVLKTQKFIQNFNRPSGS